MHVYVCVRTSVVMEGVVLATVTRGWRTWRASENLLSNSSSRSNSSGASFSSSCREGEKEEENGGGERNRERGGEEKRIGGREALNERTMMGGGWEHVH